MSQEGREKEKERARDTEREKEEEREGERKDEWSLSSDQHSTYSMCDLPS